MNEKEKENRQRIRTKKKKKKNFGGVQKGRRVEAHNIKVTNRTGLHC
jgi:hypothetical protein